MAQNKINKLELTWIGKGDEPLAIEPRLLLDTPEYSFGEVKTGTLPNGKPWPGNMLIHGDNLLALRALEENFKGAVKCIYIDPPYNTGSAFEHYDDNVEHSMWLSLMHKRLLFLYGLLSEGGSMWIQIDDNEVGYLIALCDEIFGRGNRVNIIAVKMSEVSGVKMAHVGKRLPKVKEFILVYKKGNFTVNPVRIKKSANLDAYLKYYNSIITNFASSCEEWVIEKVEKVMEREGIAINPDSVRDYKIRNAERVVYRTNNKSFSKLSFDDEIKTRRIISSTGIEYIWWEGKQMLFLNDYIEEYLGDLWLDISTINLNKEGNVDFANSKKPEKLIERVLTIASNPGDLVLDSFLGSGTTAAVAHKMNRRWIGIELGNHAYTHSFERMKSVVDGSDQGGISKAIDWQGGGGFKFYELAPSLLNKDKYGNLVINKDYNADMLAAAMAKHQGFTFSPDAELYWKQGHSSEHDFIFTTTQLITAEMLETIHDQLGEDESLLICCTKFQPECRNKFPNITIKKIPKVLLDTCEFDHDDYSLNIVSVPDIDDEEWNDIDPEDEYLREEASQDEPTLFD